MQEEIEEMDRVKQESGLVRYIFVGSPDATEKILVVELQSLVPDRKI